MDTSIFILSVCFFIIAAIYASVGFGGGSSYLALLAISGIAFESIRPTGLLCNIVVVTGGTLVFYRKGLISLKKTWPFLISSIPLAFIGGYWKLTEHVFYNILAFTLIAASFFLWIKPASTEPIRSDNKFLNGVLGGSVGFLSGLVGIGGGIFLAPILHLMNWDESKKISALASLFILVNSISALAAQALQLNKINFFGILPLIIAVFVGGQIGSRIGTLRFNATYIKRITAVLVLIAGIMILRF